MGKVLSFGIAKEITGGGVVDVPFENGITAGGLRTLLQSTYPLLKELKSFALAINGEYAVADQLINDTDEIAIIPPVSGG
jgi:molybdopterin synthase sulfur carrier subunit